jgi:hypothetical protein
MPEGSWEQGRLGDDGAIRCRFAVHVRIAVGVPAATLQKAQYPGPPADVESIHYSGFIL